MVKVSSTIKLNEAKLKELTKQQYVSLAQTADAVLTDLRDSQTKMYCHFVNYLYQMALSGYPLSLSALHPLSVQGLHIVVLSILLALLHSV